MVVFVVVIVLHGLAALWFERHHQAFRPVDTKNVPVQVALLKPERIEQQAAAAAAHPATPAPSPRPAQAPKSKPRAPAEHVLTSTRTDVKPQVAAASEAAGAAAATPASGASASAASGAGAASGATATAQPNAAAKTTAPGVKFSVPPSGDLDYDTFYNGVRNQAGTIHWASDGHRYQMIVSVPLPFVGTFSWTSEGRVDAFGLAPDQYIEQRGHRPADYAIFNRDTKQIVFTKTPTKLPLTDGAQDRFSMVMQLASLVRGDPDAYKPGVTRQFFVVDNDSGENWPIETIGDETVRTAQGFVTARHFMRLPRHDGDKRRIDVWLAPSLGWLPARLVQTEPNGTQVELLWRGKLEPPQSNVTMSGASNTSSPERNASGATSNGASTPPASPPSNAPVNAPADASGMSPPASGTTAGTPASSDATAPPLPPMPATPAPAPSQAAGTEAAPSSAPASQDASPDDRH